MKNVKSLNFKEFKDSRGSLFSVETLRDIPFKIKRVYYITGVPEGISRGFHSHRALEQVLICINGKVTIKAESDSAGMYTLKNPGDGLYIGPMVWREMANFRDNASLVVLASDYYKESDYIRDYDVFRKAADKYFKGV